MEACRLSIGGCTIRILVEDDAGVPRRDEVAEAVGEVVEDFARSVVAVLVARPPSDSTAAAAQPAPRPPPSADDSTTPVPPRAAPKASTAKAPPATRRPEDRTDPEWDRRLTVAEVHGAAVASAIDDGGPIPAAPVHTAPLRSQVWVAINGPPPTAGIYSRWEQGAELARAAGHVVRGFPSLAEVRAFLRGAAVDVPDRRR